MKIKERQSKAMADNLPYFDFDSESDAIWLKDGSATLSLKITPKDCTSFTDDDLEVLRFGLTPILGHLPEGSVFQALMLRDRSQAKTDEAFQRWVKSHNGQEDSTERRLLFEERQRLLQQSFEAGEIFQTRCYVTLRALPTQSPKSGKVLGPFSHFAFWFNGKKNASVKTRQDLLRDLESGLESLRAGLESLGFEVKHVPKDERLAIVYEWLNPERSQSVAMPALSTKENVSDRVGLTDLIESREGLSLGRSKLTVTSLKSLPEISIPAMLGAAATASTPLSLIFTAYVLNQTEERERLLRKQRMAQGMASGNQVRNLMAEVQLKDIEDTLSAIISSGEKLLGVSFQMVGRSEAPSRTSQTVDTSGVQQ